MFEERPIEIIRMLKLLRQRLRVSVNYLLRKF